CRHHEGIGVQQHLYSSSTPIPIRRQRAPTCRLIAIREPSSAQTGRFSWISTLSFFVLVTTPTVTAVPTDNIRGSECLSGSIMSSLVAPTTRSIRVTRHRIFSHTGEVSPRGPVPGRQVHHFLSGLDRAWSRRQEVPPGLLLQQLWNPH